MNGASVPQRACSATNADFRAASADSLATAICFSFPQFLCRSPQSICINGQSGREEGQQNVSYLQVIKKFAQPLVILSIACALMVAGGFFVVRGDERRGLLKLWYWLLGWMLALSGPWVALIGFTWLGLLGISR